LNDLGQALIAAVALAAAFPPLAAIYLLRRRIQDRRPSTYARARDNQLRRIREQMAGLEAPTIQIRAPSAASASHRMPEMTVMARAMTGPRDRA
jgi:hypothetical protein